MVGIWFYTSLCLLATFLATSTCASLGASPSSGKFPSALGLTPTEFQTWQEWAKKRNFGGSGSSSPWGHGMFSPADFQDWREFMNKRGFHIPDSSQSHQQFQSWLDWSKRQGLDSSAGNPFPSPQNFGKFGNFQNWGDWYAKRSSPFRQHSAVFGKMGNPAGDMQSWDEFMKRQGFGYSSQGLGHPSAGGYQSWNEWAKRMGPIMTSGGRWGDFGTGGFDFGNKQQFTDWKNMYQHSADKRQLGYKPHSFGSFHGYFTDGLQDWRSTFKGSKRNTEGGADDAGSASAVSDKAQTQ